MADLEADVVIVGAGPIGSAAAWRLAGAGLSVIVLERGTWFDYAALGQDAPDFELARQTRAHPNPNIRRGPADEPVDDEDSPIKPMIGNGVGGSSIYWSAHIPRFRPEDFRIRTLDGVGEDWPIAYDDLASYYDLNEGRVGLAAAPGDPAGAPRNQGALRLPSIGPMGRRFAEAFDALGWHWWPVDLVVGRDADEPGAARCTHLGPCEIGCPSRQRAGADRAYMRDAVAAGARLVTGARVVRLDHDSANIVTAAMCATDAGPLRVRGARFLLAANGMGTPRLLLASASRAFPDGLANGSGQVGRNLMLHPYARIDGSFPEPLGAWGRGQKAGLVCLEFYATSRERGFARGLKLQMAPGPGALGSALGWDGRALAWGEGHHEAFEARFDHVAGLTVCAEDLPEPENRITLSSRLADVDGTPAPKMTYRLSENSRRALDFGLDRAEEALFRAGALEVHRTPLRAEAGFHLMGTARMGTHPETSVVDPFGRCHGVPNLFVIDASVFVTGSAMNPTATAQAYALRTADHVLAGRAA